MCTSLAGSDQNCKTSFYSSLKFSNNGVQTIINNNNIIHIKSKTIENSSPMTNSTNVNLRMDNNNESNKITSNENDGLEIIDYPYPKSESKNFLNNSSSKKSKSDSSSVISDNNDYNKVDKDNKKSENENLQKNTIKSDKTTKNKTKRTSKIIGKRSKTNLKFNKKKNWTISLNNQDISENIKLMLKKNNDYLKRLISHQKELANIEKTNSIKKTVNYIKLKIIPLKSDDIFSRVSKTKISYKYSPIIKHTCNNESLIKRAKNKKIKKHKKDQSSLTRTGKINYEYENIGNYNEIPKYNYKYISVNNNRIKSKSKFKTEANPFSKKFIRDRKKITKSISQCISNFKISNTKK